MSYNDIVEQFKLYSISHPNITNFWISYLGLKKRHDDNEAPDLSDEELDHCYYVLEKLSAGFGDINNDDLIRLMLYKFSL
jgi:hypothetical protein